MLFRSVSNGGGGIAVAGTFTMTGGKITGNRAAIGSGLFINTTGIATLSGGEITGNTSTSSQGAVYVPTGATNGKTLNIGGPIQIIGNTGGNLYMPKGYCFKVNAPLMQNGVSAHIGITLTNYTGITDNNRIQFTYMYTSNNPSSWMSTGVYNPSVYFSSDVAGWGMEFVSSSNTEASIKPDPTPSQRVNLLWEVQLNDGTWYDPTNTSALSTKLEGYAYNSSGCLLSYNYSSATYITGVRVSHPTNGTVYASTTGSPAAFERYSDSFGSTSFSDTNRVGKYAFAIMHTSTGFFPLNSFTFNVEVKKKDVTVTFNNANMKATFGMTDAEILAYLKAGKNTTVTPNTDLWTVTGVENGELIELAFNKQYGTDAASYLVTATAAAASASNNNGNYNIKITNTGKLTIDRKSVV